MPIGTSIIRRNTSFTTQSIINSISELDYFFLKPKNKKKPKIETTAYKRTYEKTRTKSTIQELRFVVVIHRSGS